MDLVDVQELVTPQSEAEIPPWRPGDAYVAGGTWLFSEPQPGVRRLIDLSRIPATPVSLSEGSLRIAAGCTYRELRGRIDQLGQAAQLFDKAIRTLSSSFKTWGMATVGGNVCLAYPKSMMAPVFTLLGAEYELVTPGGGERVVPAADFQTGDRRTVRRPGEYVRAIRLPVSELYGRFALAKESYTATSHAVAMVIGRRAGSETSSQAASRDGEKKAGAAQQRASGRNGAIRLVASAATTRPVPMEVREGASIDEVRRVMGRTLRSVQFLDDGHGSKSYRLALLDSLAGDVWSQLHGEVARDS